VPLRPSLARQLAQAGRAMRPKQWIKNGLIILAVVFAHRANDLATDERVVLAVLAFSLLASAVYIVNDIADRHKDRRHPTKRYRPIASGRLSIPLALGVACLLRVLAAALTALITTQQEAALSAGTRDPFPVDGGSAALFVATLIGYILLNIAYSLWIKHQVLWDVFVIATGFVLRALAGAFVAMVAISPWFYLCTLFLSLFLALGKRRAELVGVSGAGETRTSLRDYSALLLDQLMTIVVACTLITYSLYTFQASGSGGRLLLITIPIVIFGAFRYLYLIYVKDEGESPDRLLLRDKQLLGAVLLCVLVAVAALYGVPYLRAVF
jgi:4-hydroxybenzoate polyprenyltransferase